MSGAIQTCLKTMFKPFAYTWRAYRYVRDSPTSLGNSKLQKMGATSVYLLLGGIAVYLCYTVLTHQAVFTDLVERKVGAYEAPSVIFCPLKSKLYEYTAFYLHDRIKSLNLTAKEVNALGKGASTNTLESSETKKALIKHSSLSPQELWKEIVTGQYWPKEYDWKEDYTTKYNYGVDFDCHGSTRPSPLSMDEELGIPYSADGWSSIHRFNCHRLHGLWLTDKSYCLLWNNTGSELSFSNGKFDLKATRNYFRLKPYAFTGIRIWMGSLFTDRIALLEYQYYLHKYFNYQIFKIHVPKSKLCQPLLETCDKNFKAGPKLEHHWVYPTSVVLAEPEKYKRDPPWSVIHLREEASWWEIIRITRFVDFKVFEVVGNIVSFFVGISALAIGKVLILFLKSYFKNSQKILVFLQGIGILILLATIAWLQVLDILYAYAEKNRYLNMYDFQTPTGGLALGKEIQICPRMMSVYNKTAMEEYNISQPLFNYLGVVGLGVIPSNYIRPPRHRSDFFMWDDHTTPELGFHWHFMVLPLQHFGKELYDARMNQVEQEYQSLATKMGIHPTEAPGYEVLKGLFLQPCKMIKYCYIDREIVEDCCRYFHYTVTSAGSDYTVCLELKNKQEKIRQTKPGKLNGLKILFDLGELKKHVAPQLWYDYYLKKHVDKCRDAYNCSSEFPTEKGYWNPGDLWHIFVNHREPPRFGEYVKGIGLGDHMESGATIEVALELTHKRKLKRNIKGKTNCREDDYPYYEFKFILQEMLKKRCECHICYGARRIPLFRNVPCCQPKILGRCITSMDWYDFSICAGNSKGERNPISHFVGNISSDVPYNSLILGFPYGCPLPESKYAQYFEEISKELSFSEVGKSPCDEWTVFDVSKAGYNFNKSMHGNDRDTNYYGFNFYYPLIQYNDFMELDLLDPIELISLFAGAIGLIIGFSFVGIIESTCYCFYWMMTLKNQSLLSLSKKMYYQTTVIFSQRFAFEKKEEAPNLVGFTNHPHDTSGVPQNKINSIQQQENIGSDHVCLKSDDPQQPGASSAVVQVESSFGLVSSINDKTEIRPSAATIHLHHDQDSPDAVLTSVDSHEIAKLGAGSMEVNGNKGPAPTSSSVHPFPHSGSMSFKDSNCQIEGQVSLDKEKNMNEFGFKTQVAMAAVVGVAIALAMYTCLELQHKMDLSETTTQFDMNGDVTLISPPSLGICLPHSVAIKNSIFKFEHARSFISKAVTSCIFKDERVDCSDVFAVFLRILEFDCALTNFSIPAGSKILPYDYLIELNMFESMNVWIGDLQTVHKNRFDASEMLEPGELLEVKYQQWEIINSDKCGLSRKYLCPACNSGEDQEYCCPVESMQGFNLTHTPPNHDCHVSFYKTSIVHKTGIIPNRSSIKVASAVNVKRVVRKEIRRTLSEKFMLYTGFADLFIGLNIANVVFAVFRFLARCLTKNCHIDNTITI